MLTATQASVGAFYDDDGGFHCPDCVNSELATNGPFVAVSKYELAHDWEDSGLCCESCGSVIVEPSEPPNEEADDE